MNVVAHWRRIIHAKVVSVDYKRNITVDDKETRAISINS